LTLVEQSLVEHVGRGEWLDLADGDEGVDEAAMRSWGKSRICGATVIRDILRGRLAADPDPHGLRLRGARITGRLDLENLTTDVNLELKDCFLEEGILAGNARLASVDLVGCQIEHPVEPPLAADSLTCSALGLDEARVIGHAGGGAVRLLGAHISGQLSCIGADLRNDSGPALNADGLQVGQSMFLRDGFTATGSGVLGAVRLAGAHISGGLECDGADLRNDSGPVLDAGGLQVSQSMYLREGFTARGSGHDGAVRLVGAYIGGNLECDGADLQNDYGPALDADGIRIERAMFLRGGFTARGSGHDGAVRLLGARVGDQFVCTDAAFLNDSGPALQADGLQVGPGMYLREGFTARGSSHDGAVRLVGAHIGGNLECDGADLQNDSGPALQAGGLQVDQDMYLREGFMAIGGGEGVAVDLTGTRVGGAFLFDSTLLEHTVDSHRRLAVEGLTYAGVPGLISPQGWRELLRHGTPGYAAQPYQQLAAGYRALGDERQARETLMAQRDDQIARADARWGERLWGWITKITLGYGYQPWRALLFLGAVMAVSCVLAWSLGAHGALAQTSKTATPGRSCTVIQQVSVGLDLNLPVGTSVARADCDLTSDAGSVTAAWLSVVGWVLRILAWAFAALFFAGFTGAVRKT
jgi:hypothetical protein